MIRALQGYDKRCSYDVTLEKCSCRLNSWGTWQCDSRFGDWSVRFLREYKADEIRSHVEQSTDITDAKKKQFLDFEHWCWSVDPILKKPIPGNDKQFKLLWRDDPEI